MSRFESWLRRAVGRHHAETADRLDLCSECGQEFVYPVSWSESGPADWWLHLRCGSCGASREIVAGNHAVEAFDRQLDREMGMIEANAERLGRESFMEEAETFGAALRMDLLSADDFR